MNKVNLIRRIGALCLVFILVLGMIPNTAYMAVEGDRDLTVAVNKDKVTVEVYDTDDNSIVVNGIEEENGFLFKLDSDVNYTLKITAKTSGDGVESVVDDVDETNNLSTYIGNDFIYMEQIASGSTAAIGRTVVLRSEVFYDYKINVNTANASVALTTTTPIGAGVGADPAITEADYYIYKLNPYEVYRMTVTALNGEKLDLVLGQDAAGAPEKVVDDVKIENNADTEKSISFYSQTPFDANVTIDGGDGNITIRNTDIADETESIYATGIYSVFTKGGNYTIEVTPNEGYGIKAVSIDGVEQEVTSAVGTQIYTVSNVMDEVAISVEYAPVYNVTINVDKGNADQNKILFNELELPNGTYSTKVVAHGDIELELIPTPDYYVSGISVKNGSEEAVELTPDDVTIQNNVYTYTIQDVGEDVTFDIVFSRIQDITDYTLQNDPSKPESVFTWKSEKNGDSSALTAVDVEEVNNVLKYILTKDETIKLSVDGKKIATTQDGEFKDALSYADTSEIGSVYVKNENATTLSDYITKYTFNKAVKIVLDNTAPVVTIANDEEIIWLAGDAEDGKVASDTISITSTEGTGENDTSVAKVVYVNVANADEATILAGTNIAESNGNYTITVTCEELVNKGVTELTYYVYAVNESGYISEAKTKTVKLDAVAPNVTSIIADDTKGFIDKIFTKDKDVTLYVAADDVNGVGLRDITLYVNGTAVGTVPVSGFVTYTDGNSYASFNLTLNEYTDYNIYAVATDNVGNVGAQYAAVEGTSGSDITSGVLYFDAVSPTIKINLEDLLDEENWAQKDEHTYYVASGLFTPKFDIKDYVNETDKDKASGLASYTVSINDNVVLNKTYTEKKAEDTITLTNSTYGSIAADKYVIKVSVTDAAGNTYEDTYTCYVDDTAPVISTTETVNGKTITGYDRYQFFGNGTSKYKITVENDITDAELGYITYQLENEGVINLGQVSGNVATFEIAKEYKGKVTVTIKDKVGNATVTEFYAIVETANEANATTPSKVTITPETTSYKDASKNNLYTADTKVAVVVEDTYSGIASVAWAVNGQIDTGKNSSGRINVVRNQAGDAWSIGDSNWTMEENSDNLVTKLSGEIPVTHNSNNIEILVTLTDNAGNTRTQKQVISIDKTAPKVEIKFNHTEGDTVYNVDRTATITIYDNNFVAGNTSVKITNTDGSIPKVSGWKSNNNAKNLAYSATVTFSADGDYNMQVSTKDAANRGSNVAKIQQFTIDKTAPVISVAYDNTPVINDTYFAATRTATVTINEHNFNASNVIVEGVATLNGAPAAFPGVTGWASGGDTRSTNLVFNQDALYSYNISVTDAAGNIAQLSENAFTVDTTAPVIEISGVEDMSANNGVVAPVITITDENYDASGVNIELVGSNHGQVQANGSFSDIANGQVFTFANFAEEQDADDLYTLNVTKTDKAGNMFEDSISFSVNRFGSVYTFSEELAEINGNYVQEAVDVVITETNVDSLDLDSVKVVLTTNGSPDTLERGEDYTISQTGGAGSWSQYEYRIGKEMFQEDGSYSIAIYSVDNAGNVNENINEVKEAEVFFGIDTVNPIITAIDLESGKTYEATEHRAVLSITDNLVLGEVVITVNGEPVEYEVNGSDYAFVLSEASKAYTISVSVVDKAGNLAVITFEDVWVTTSALVRVLNSPVAVAVGAGTVGVAGVGGGAFVFMRRKNVIKVKRK